MIGLQSTCSHTRIFSSYPDSPLPPSAATSPFIYACVSASPVVTAPPSRKTLSSLPGTKRSAPSRAAVATKSARSTYPNIFCTPSVYSIFFNWYSATAQLLRTLLFLFQIDILPEYVFAWNMRGGCCAIVMSRRTFGFVCCTCDEIGGGGVTYSVAGRYVYGEVNSYKFPYI